MITDKGVAVPDDMAAALECRRRSTDGLRGAATRRSAGLRRLGRRSRPARRSGRNGSPGWPSTSAPTSAGPPRSTARRTRSAGPDRRLIGSSGNSPRTSPVGPKDGLTKGLLREHNRIDNEHRYSGSRPGRPTTVSPCRCWSWPGSASAARSARRWPPPPRSRSAPKQLGYHRFWVAEHHGMPAVASSAPGRAAGPPGRQHQHHPARVGRRHAAEPRADGGRRAVRHAGRAAPGPDRPGPWPRAGQRPADRVRAAPPAGGPGIRRFRRSARRVAALHERATSRRTTRSRGSGRPRPSRCRSTSSARPTTAPGWPPGWVCRSRSRTISPAPAATPTRRWTCTGRCSGRRRRWTSRTR